jgi:mono/diheme cytochrome c family protein
MAGSQGPARAPWTTRSRSGTLGVSRTPRNLPNVFPFRLQGVLMLGSFPVLFRPCSVLVLATLLGITTPGSAQKTTEEEPYRPGLVAVLRDDRGNTATRVDQRLSFLWVTAPDPRLVPGAFSATWQGHLLVTSPGEHRFFLFGTGEAGLKVAGKMVLESRALKDGWHSSQAIELPGEHVPIEVTFRATGREARLMVLWSGPQFGREPIPSRLLFHKKERDPGADFERGRLLARSLRCAKCHAGETPGRPAPALDALSGNLSRQWLVARLTGGHLAPRGETIGSSRRMPALGLTRQQAEDIAAWLLTQRPPKRPEARPAPPPPPPAPKAKPKKGKKPPRVKPSATIGERLFLTLGCLACHTWKDHGTAGLFDGGNLTQIADKRPAGFFAAWLTDPARLNPDHRMPVFALSADERTSLTLFLAGQKSSGEKPDFSTRASAEAGTRGKKLIEQFRCAACHRLPGAGGRPSGEKRAAGLNGKSDWGHSCLGKPDPVRHRPGYGLTEGDTRSLRLYFTRRQPAEESASADGRLALAEHNCLACHAREGTREALPLLPPPLADGLPALAKRYPALVEQVPAMTPPALNSVGDKLTDEALAFAIARQGPAHRPYLKVRMPRFPLRDEELKTLVRHLVIADRIPPGLSAKVPSVDPAQRARYALAGGRLVSADGFGCTSCHQVGSVLPSQAPLNARGADLSQLGKRIRREWFDRWLHDPARIVPRMEMPSVQVPVTGVLGGKLEEQVAAVWYVLNVPGFEPPPPNPVRIFRQSGNKPRAEPLLVTDVLEQGDSVVTRPFLVGLANRHNVLFDIETGALSLWAVGDTARQRTRGKTWFWELAGSPVLESGLSRPDVSLMSEGGRLTARTRGQFVTEVDAWEVSGPALTIRYRLAFPRTADREEASGERMVRIERRLAPLVSERPGVSSGFSQELTAGPLPAGARLRLEVLSADAARRTTLTPDGREIRLGDRLSSRIVLREPARVKFSADRTHLLLTGDKKQSARVVLHYLTGAPIDRFPEFPVQEAVHTREVVEIAPGFSGVRLPLPDEIMPTGLAWRPDGRLVFSSLKGQVFEAIDSNRDGDEDRLILLADGLPAPYGINAGPGYVDVSAKYAVLRIRDGEPGSRRVEVVASGWGYTKDYHDWAVGLPSDGHGGYYLGIPCQQDKRPVAAARFRGNVLRLVPRRPTDNNPRCFTLEPVSAGHRFPMGLALDRRGELFVTDNQGNYNPFNELNHVRPGVHFGFINALDRGKPAPPLTPPAIDIPHPWTRSVNGICFLDTPPELRKKLGREAFGPIEGHLVGCEYDTRRLIRMSLQKVGNTFQGAAYPLSIPAKDQARGLLGPVVCGVSPRSELYVGSIRDSGWGAGNNVGEIVRIKVEPEKFPGGIAEVRATSDGFVIDLFQPVDRTLARVLDTYTIESYRRESTPAYGGPDRDRRTERVTGVTVSADGRRVNLKLAGLRAGFVYQIRLRNLAPGGGAFHPAEAHYTMRVIPR